MDKGKANRDWLQEAHLWVSKGILGNKFLQGEVAEGKGE